MAKKHTKRTLRTLFNYHFRASEGGNKFCACWTNQLCTRTAKCRMWKNMWNTRPWRITPSSISTILHMILSLNVTKKSRPYRLPSQMIGKTCLTRLVLVNWVVLLRNHSVLYGCMSNCKMSIKSTGKKNMTLHSLPLGSSEHKNKMSATPNPVKIGKYMSH